MFSETDFFNNLSASFLFFRWFKSQYLVVIYNGRGRLSGKDFGNWKVLIIPEFFKIAYEFLIRAFLKYWFASLD